MNCHPQMTMTICSMTRYTMRREAMTPTTTQDTTHIGTTETTSGTTWQTITIWIRGGLLLYLITYSTGDMLVSTRFMEDTEERMRSENIILMIITLMRIMRNTGRFMENMDTIMIGNIVFTKELRCLQGLVMLAIRLQSHWSGMKITTTITRNMRYTEHMGSAQTRMKIVTYIRATSDLSMTITDWI